MLNTFSGIGRLSTDPEINRNNGSISARFNIAINEFYKKDNDLHKATHWIPCIAHGRLAEICGEFLTRGSQVAVRGPVKLQTASDENGQKKTNLEVNVLELEFLSTRSYEDQTA